jgi:hypothetical protein
MNVVRSTVPSLLLSFLSVCAMASPEPLCVIKPSAMPRSWQPSPELVTTLSEARWSADEAKDAEYAVQRGLDELTDYFSHRPSTVMHLGEDAVEPFLDATYSAANMLTLQVAARDEGRRVLTALLEPSVRRQPESATCQEYSRLVTFTIYSHALLPASDVRIPHMVALTNAAYHACGSLSVAMGYDYRQKLAAQELSTDDVWDLLMWSITLTDALVVPDLDLPDGSRDLPPALWRFLADYPFVGARAYQKGASDNRFYDTAYLVTHIAYLPTGYGRHPIYIADAPNVYHFLRENFYLVLQMDELDLVAEFVDLFRQYGCTERTDLQVRDGTRQLLKLFHASDDHWMSYRGPHEPADISEYDTVHKAWTGMAGVRVRVPEAAKPGTYGGVVRQWLGYPQ